MQLTHIVLQLRLFGHDLSAPVEGLGDGLVRPSPEGPVQHEGWRRRGTAECQPGDQAADFGHAERNEKLADSSCAPFTPFSPARSATRKASASMASVMCRCQPCQLLTS